MSTDMTSWKWACPCPGQKVTFISQLRRFTSGNLKSNTPDSYIGSVQTVTEPMWVHDGANMVQREITFVPGLFKIFDEILVNAADNKQRDPSMDTIKVDINAETNTISVYNNGSGIPVVHHKEENMYVPTMIFGHLLTSSNFSDEDLKTTGGRNGFGAKLCNVFSSKFTLETAGRNKSFKQTWTNNMSKVSEPIVKYSNKEFTKIMFRPDLKKFNMKELDEDTVAMFSRRAYDIAASSKGVKVYLNGKRLPVKDFKSYVDQYLKGKEDETGGQIKCVFESVDRWDVAVAVSDKGFQQMSFVNSIATTKVVNFLDHTVILEAPIDHLHLRADSFLHELVVATDRVVVYVSQLDLSRNFLIQVAASVRD